MAASDSDSVGAADPGSSAIDLYRAVFEMGPEPAVLIDMDTERILDANAATLEALGLTRPDVVGRTPSELLGSPDESLIGGLRAKAASAPGGTPLIGHLKGSDQVRAIEVYASRVDLPGRTILHVVGHDATERLANERRHARLARLASSLTVLDVQLSDAGSEERVWRLLADRLVDPGGLSICAVGLVEADRRGIRIQALAGVPEAAGLGLEQLEGQLRRRDAQVRRSIESGQPYRYELERDRAPETDRALEIFGQLDVIVVPIRVASFTVGILACVAGEADFFGETETAMLVQIARRIGVRIGELQRTERELQLVEALLAERERSARFSSAMATIDRDIGRLARPVEIYQALSRLPVDLGICFAAWTGLVVRGRGGTQLKIVASAGDVGEHRGLLDAPVDFLAPPFELSETLVVDDVVEDGRFRRRRNDLEGAHVRSLAAIPLRIGPVIVGEMAYYAHEVGAFGTEQVGLLERVAANAGSRLGVIQADERRWQAEKKLAQIQADSPSNAPAMPGREA